MADLSAQPGFSTIDEYWMRRALRLAALGREAAPNPMVGCVIVDPFGRKVGEGYHVRPGEPHAEVIALLKAGENARGATVYISLEACSHHGRTPPCSSALIQAGVAKVVVAMVDPDKRVAGKGIDILRDAGIMVEVGLREADARRLNESYIYHRSTGMPFVTVKVAMTLDGKIATVSGDSKWITSEVTRKWVHRQLRSRNQAIFVGRGTITADNPSLNIRLAHHSDLRQPIRIAVDTRLSTPLDSNFVKSAKDGKSLIAFVDARKERQETFLAAGVELLRCGANPHGRVDLTELLRLLGTGRDITSVLVEGGAELVAALFESRLVNRYICTIGSQIVGGKSAPGPVGGYGISQLMSEAVQTTGLCVRRSGRDVVLDCRIRPMV